METFPHEPARNLTKREYFAAKAMQGFCANATFDVEDDKRLSTWAVAQADALIKELNEETA